MTEARVEVRQALDEAAQDVREALDEAAQEIRQAVDGIPVPIVPGTRVTEAVAQPPAPAAPAAPALAEAPAPQPPVPPAAPGFPGRAKHPGAPHPAPSPAPKPKPLLAVKPGDIRVIPGQVSATEDRALADARKQLEKELTEWLDPHGVPRSWKPAPRQIDAMILETKIKPVVKDQAPYKDYGKLYDGRAAGGRLSRADRRLHRNLPASTGPESAWSFWAVLWRSS